MSQLLIPYVVAVTYGESKESKESGEEQAPLRGWFPKTSGFADHYLIGMPGNIVAALYENHAYALRVHQTLLAEGYNVDMFPCMKWSMHPMKSDFVKTNLMPTLSRMAREALGDHLVATPMVDSSVHTLYFTGNALSGRDEVQHSALLSLHLRVHQFVMDISLQRLELPELEPTHLELLNLKIVKILHQRAQRVNSMGLFEVGDDAEEKVHQCMFFTFCNGHVKVTFVGMLREVRAVVDRIRNIRPFVPATHVLPCAVKGDWECLHRNAVFQKNHAQRRSIETKNAVLITCDQNHQVLLSALTAEDASAGGQAFQEMLSMYRKVTK